MAKKKNPLLSCMKHIAVAFLAAFGVMMVSSFIITAVLEEVENQMIINLIVDVIMMTVYAVCFYRIHMRFRLGTYIEHSETLDWKGELIAYIRGEGKFLILFYGVCAVFNAVCDFLPGGPVSFIGTVFTDVILGTLFGRLPIPVLGSVLAFLYICAMTCALELLRSREIHKDELTVHTRRNEK